MKQTLSLLVIATLLGLSQVEGGAIQGVNLGGWMVLEPWITPSLFYPFLNKDGGDIPNVGFDSSTFCEVMGLRGIAMQDLEYANKWMRAHWDSWYTEEHIKNLSMRGVERVRLPIGDWTMKPYGVYERCMDGAKDKISWMMDTCLKYNIGVLIDVHTAKGSQNGFDNSGLRSNTTWLTNDTFQYIEQPLWSSQYDIVTQKNGELNYANMKGSLRFHEQFLKEFGSHPALIGYEPVNEPWWNTDLPLLADHYRMVRKLVQRYAPAAYFVFHDSFRPTDPIWSQLFADGDWNKVAMDHHGYMAFWDYNQTDTLNHTYFCDRYEAENNFTVNYLDKMEVWMGEWSFALDNCAQWLQGFNDQTGRHQASCQPVKCPDNYYTCPEGSAATDCAVDPDVPVNGPAGINQWDNDQILIEKGMCWKDSNVTQDVKFAAVANCTVQTIDKYYNVSMMWTAHNQLEERWDYIKAWDLGYFAAKDNGPMDKDISKSSPFFQ